MKRHWLGGWCLFLCTFFVMTVLSLILETYEWDTLKDYAKKYENDRDSGTRSLISGINRNYFEPYVMELVFEFTVNANTKKLDITVFPEEKRR